MNSSSLLITQTKQRLLRLHRARTKGRSYESYLTYKRKKRNEFVKEYSPRYAAITSCSAREACSPAGCSHRLEYASWGQVTICQIKPIGQCQVCGVQRVTRVNVSCIQHTSDRRVASSPLANFRKASRGVQQVYSPIDWLTLSRERDRETERARKVPSDMASRNVVYDFRSFRSF